MLTYAISQAKSIPYEQGQRRIYSVVVDKKDRILSEGSNSYTKTHPLQAKFAEEVDLPQKIFLHAEISALVKIRSGEPYKIYIARVDSKGEPMLAAPCPICALAIKEAKIESIEHTI